MKLLTGIILVVVTLVIVLSMSTGAADQSTGGSAKQSIKIETIRADIAAGGQLVDVRTQEEFSQGHIAEAINLPVQSMKSGSMPATGKDMPLYVYCRSGSRSAQAASLLKDAGYTNVTDLGAMSAVQKLGGKVEQ